MTKPKKIVEKEAVEFVISLLLCLVYRCFNKTIKKNGSVMVCSVKDTLLSYLIEPEVSLLYKHRMDFHYSFIIDTVSQTLK